MPAQNIDVILRVLNSRRFQTEMYAAGRAARNISGSFDEAARSASGLSYATGVASSGLYAIGAASRVVGYGIGALTVATVGLGVQFNATMESNSLAFDKFAGGAKKAKKFTLELFQIAKDTPFAFGDITTAARRFLAFGFSVKQTTKLLKIMGDTLAYTGGGTDEIYRMAKAFGDIRAKGRLMQQELNQLANLGIPAVPILQEQLGLSTKQLRNIGRAGIDADTAIRALMEGLTKKYGGGAKKYMETFNGQWQRLKDNIALAAGTVTGSSTGLFNWLKTALRAFNDFSEKMNDMFASKEFKAKVDSVKKWIKGAFAVAADWVGKFIDAWAPAKPFFDNVLWPLVKGIAKGLIAGIGGAFAILIPAIKIFAKVLGLVGKAAKPFKGVIEAIGQIIGFFAGGPILKGIAALGKFGFVFKIVALVARLALTPYKLMMGIFMKIGGVITGLLGRIFRLIPGIRNIGAIAGQVANTLKNSFANAFIWVTSRLGKFGVKLFDIGVKLADAFVKGIGNIGKRMLGAFTSAVAFAGSIGSSIKKWLNDHTILGDRVHLPGPLPDFTMPALAGGGLITGGGYALVGERGPEVVKLAAGSTVIPNRPATATAGSSGPPSMGAVLLRADMPIIIERREIGRVVGDFVAERSARR